MREPVSSLLSGKIQRNTRNLGLARAFERLESAENNCASLNKNRENVPTKQGEKFPRREFRSMLNEPVKTAGL
jgi:hypothetical protein